MLVHEIHKQNDEGDNIIESKILFKESSSIRIQHGNDVYILRITKANKLILTK